MNYPTRRARVLGAVLGILFTAAAVAWIVRAGSANGDAAGKRPTAEAEQPSPADKVAKQVVIDNFRFEPRELTISAGTRVTWVNRDDVPHTATSTATPRAFDSKTLDTDGQFSHVFTTPGTYEYFCAVHPHMRGKIVVE